MEIWPNISEGTLRLSIFLGALVLLAILEILIPKRALTQPKPRRWITNLAIAGLSSLVVRLMAKLAAPIAAVSAALWAEANGWGLLNQISAPRAIEVLVAIVLLDLAIYAQHVVSHKVPLLWRLHRVHHSDLDIDVTTAIRFHPIEIGLSMIWKIIIVLTLGASAFAVILFEILLNACAMFNHANIALPKKVDALLRQIIVTPDMHRVHHSIKPHETNSNYGFNLSIWDRIFGTYTHQPEEGHKSMTIGLSTHQNKNPTKISWALIFPFLGKNPKQD